MKHFWLLPSNVSNLSYHLYSCKTYILIFAHGYCVTIRKNGDSECPMNIVAIQGVPLSGLRKVGSLFHYVYMKNQALEMRLGLR